MTSLSITLWLLVAGLRFALAATSLRYRRSHPLFVIYLWFEVFASTTALALYGAVRLGAATWLLYFAVFYIYAILGNLLALATAWEQARKIFWPRLSLPSWVHPRMFTAVSGLFALMLTGSPIFRAIHGNYWAKVMITADQWFTGLLLSVFAVIVFFRFNLNISRQQKKATGICIGFVLYLSVALIAVTVRASGSISAGKLAGQISAIVYFIVLAWWGYVLQLKERTAAKATPEQHQQVLREFNRVRAEIEGYQG